MPRHNFASTVIFCGFCGLTVAAIGITVAALYGAVGGVGLAAAVGLVAIVQLAILIDNRRQALAATQAAARAAAHEQHVSKLTALAIVNQDRAGDGRIPPRQVPEGADLTPPRPAAEDEPSPRSEDDADHVSSVFTEDAAGDEPSALAEDAAHDEPDAAAGGARKTLVTGIRLLDQGQLELHLEPVVELTKSSTVYYRSNLALARPDGSRMGPFLLSTSAERGGFAPALDLALFQRVGPVIRHLKALGRRAGVFCPVNPQSFAERDVLEELIAFLRANRDAAAGMVMEMSQPALAALSTAGMEGLAYLAELGATLSLSEVRLDGPDPATLHLLGFRFMDLDIAALASAHGWEACHVDGEVGRLARRAEQEGLTVIAANVARPQELDRVRPYVRLARGTLFSPPRVVRRDIIDLPLQAAAA